MILRIRKSQKQIRRQRTMKNEMYYFEGTEEERVLKLIELYDSGKIKKGAFIKAIFKSQPKPKAAYKGSTIEKTTEGVYRLGIEYSHTEAFKELDRDLQGLPLSQRRLDGYGEFLQYTITEDGQKKEFKIRMYIVEGAKSQSKYTIDGKETTFADLVEMGALSEKKPSTNPLIMFTVFVKNLVAISVAE